jgi:hypothetical protein
MIVSTSRRTDIPAYYADWLIGRLDAGYCLVRNPFDARRSTRVGLAPEEVDFIVLWTRDPRPLSPRIRELDGRGLRSYAHMTITGYPPALEPGAPPLGEAIDALRELSDIVGPRRVLWRYDPVFVAEGMGVNWHLRNFERIASALEGATGRVTLSLLDEYSGTASRLARSGFPGAIFGSDKAARARGTESAPGLPDPYRPLLVELAAIAASRGMRPLACAEPYDLSPLGIEAGACVDAGLAASLWGLALPERSGGGLRRECRCAKSVDIGAYGSCPRACAYCYANRARGRLERRGREDESL